MLPNHERNAAPTAKVWLSALFLFVSSTIRKNARTGGKGINQMSVSVVIEPPRISHMAYRLSRLAICNSPLHHVDIIGDHGVAAAIDRDDQRQTDSHFRCRHREDNDRKHLTCH